MKIVAIQGSPRKGGNTEIVLDAVLEGLGDAAADADVQIIRAAAKTVKGCVEDFACQMVPDGPGCSVDDDMDEIYDALLAADLMIWATPVFCCGATAQMKAILDRLYACFKFNEDPPRCLLTGKQMAIVVTAGGGQEDGADLVVQMHQQLARLAGVTDRGHFFASFLETPSQTRGDEPLLKRAREFGESLAAPLP